MTSGVTACSMTPSLPHKQPTNTNSVTISSKGLSQLSASHSPRQPLSALDMYGHVLSQPDPRITPIPGSLRARFGTSPGMPTSATQAASSQAAASPEQQQGSSKKSSSQTSISFGRTRLRHSGGAEAVCGDSCGQEPACSSVSGSSTDTRPRHLFLQDVLAIARQCTRPIATQQPASSKRATGNTGHCQAPTSHGCSSMPLPAYAGPSPVASQAAQQEEAVLHSGDVDQQGTSTQQPTWQLSAAQHVQQVSAEQSPTPSATASPLQPRHPLSSRSSSHSGKPFCDTPRAQEGLFHEADTGVGAQACVSSISGAPAGTGQESVCRATQPMATGPARWPTHTQACAAAPALRSRQVRTPPAVQHGSRPVRWVRRSSPGLREDGGYRRSPGHRWSPSASSEAASVFARLACTFPLEHTAGEEDSGDKGAGGLWRIPEDAPDCDPGSHTGCAEPWDDCSLAGRSDDKGSRDASDDEEGGMLGYHSFAALQSINDGDAADDEDCTGQDEHHVDFSMHLHSGTRDDQQQGSAAGEVASDAGTCTASRSSSDAGALVVGELQRVPALDTSTHCSGSRTCSVGDSMGFNEGAHAGNTQCSPSGPNVLTSVARDSVGTDAPAQPMPSASDQVEHTRESQHQVDQSAQGFCSSERTSYAAHECVSTAPAADSAVARASFASAASHDGSACSFGSAASHAFSQASAASSAYLSARSASIMSGVALTSGPLAAVAAAGVWFVLHVRHNDHF